MLVDVLHHAIGNEVAYWLSLPCSSSHISRGDCQCRDFECIYCSLRNGQLCEVSGIAWPRHSDEVSEIPHFVSIFPAHDFCNSVSAGNEEELCVWVFAANIAQSVNGVGDAWAVDIDSRDGESRVGRGGNHCHQVAIFRVGDVLIQFEHWTAGGHEDHFVEVVYPCHFGCGNQVAVVNRVEGATHDADSQMLVMISLR